MPSREQELMAQLTGGDGQLKTLLEDFRYDATQDGWWNINTRKFYKEARAVNAMIPKERWTLTSTDPKKAKLIKPSEYMPDVGTGLVVDGSIWWPGRPLIVEGYFVTDEGVLIPRDGSRLFNTYRSPPLLPPAKTRKEVKEEGNLWAQHIRDLWPIPEQYNFFFDYFAHMLQRPEVKPNSAIVLSGEQGIGKDTALTPIKFAIGDWNVELISPDELTETNTPWVQTLFLVVNEMRGTKEAFSASAMYEKMKTLTAAPPDMLGLTQKYMKKRYVRNLMRVAITTNSPTSMFIHPNDRRFMVMHSSRKKNWQGEEYFTRLMTWLTEEGGNEEVARLLLARDISNFNPKKEPPKTAAFKAVVSRWDEPNDDAVARALDKLGRPPAFFQKEMREVVKNTTGFVTGDEDEIKALLRAKHERTHRMAMSDYFYLKLDPPSKFKGTKPQSFEAAWVKFELMNSPDVVDRLLKERGAKLADGNDLTVKDGDDGAATAPTGDEADKTDDSGDADKVVKFPPSKPRRSTGK